MMNIRFIASCLLSLILFSTAQAELKSVTGPSQERFFSVEELIPLVKSKISKLYNIPLENLQLESGTKDPDTSYLIFTVIYDKERAITFYTYLMTTNTLYSSTCSSIDKLTEAEKTFCSLANNAELMHYIVKNYIK